MHLWTEYEGRTIAEHYTLGKLLRSEGRNGFFATADKDGHPAVIRLTEAHYDEAEQLRRWRQVSEVHQDNLIEIEQVGQTTMEGIALTYALMEPEDANLGDVLKERPLTTAETMQVAKAVLSALRALHASGLVHEHVEPSNVLAVGETVKLRSDCVRECVPDGEFNTAESCADLRRGDLRGFGTLLLRCLTLENEWTAAHHNLPDPFRRVIPKALDGSWTLEQLGAALDPQLFAAHPVPNQASGTVSQEGVRGSGQRASYTPPEAPIASPPADHFAAEGLPLPAAPAPALPARPLVSPGVLHGTERNTTGDLDAGTPQNRAGGEPNLPLRARAWEEEGTVVREPSRAIWAVVAVVALLLVWLGWHFLGGGGHRKAAPTAAVGAPVAPIAETQPTAPPPAAPSAAEASVSGASGWYVIAYTYNHQDQALHKVRELRRNHNSLHPQVFTPTGHAPFFVSLGGGMANQEQAASVWRHARRVGLPRDTFVRHY